MAKTTFEEAPKELAHAEMNNLVMEFFNTSPEEFLATSDTATPTLRNDLLRDFYIIICLLFIFDSPIWCMLADNLYDDLYGDVGDWVGVKTFYIKSVAFLVKF